MADRVVFTEGFRESIGAHQPIPVPYVVIGEPSVSADVVLCYSPDNPDALERIGKLQDGSRVLFRGTFHQFTSRGDGAVVTVVRSCLPYEQ